MPRWLPLNRICERISRPTACQNVTAGSLKITGISQFHSHIVTAAKRARNAGMKIAAAAMDANFAASDHWVHFL